MLKKNKNHLLIIVISSLLFVVSIFIEKKWRNYFLLVIYFLSAKETLKRCFLNFKVFNFSSESSLMTLASLGAILIGETEEAVAVNIFYNIGVYFEELALFNSRKSLSALLSLKSEKVRLIKNNKYCEVLTSDAKVNDIYELRPGEKVPLDGKIVEGETSVNTSNITGESLPLYCKKGDNIVSGYLNIDGVVKVQVEHAEEDCVVSKIIAMVEEATSKKSKAETFINHFASIYTPLVIVGAILLAILPPLFFNYSWSIGFARALNFLVISCPCALVLSVPLAFFKAISVASKRGIILKSSAILEKINSAKQIAFDKTGTLTNGTLKIEKIVSLIAKEEALSLAASLENYSNHPLASAFPRGPYKLNDIKEIAGKGLIGSYQNKKLALGNQRLLADLNITATTVADLYLVVDNQLVAYFYLSDEIKEEAQSILSSLKKMGVKRLVVLSGDNLEKVTYLKKQLGILEAHHSLSPLDKLKHIGNLKKEGLLIYVGDGINDAAALSESDVGIGMGRGSQIALEAADIVLVSDELKKIKVLFKLAKKVMLIVRENIALAIGIKLIVLALSIFGYANMWMAVFADVGVTLICLYNSFRIN